MKILAKVPYLTHLGGMLRPVRETTEINLLDKTVTLPNGAKIGLIQTRSPLFNLQGKMFYKKIFEYFFIPIAIVIFLWFIALKLTLFSSNSLIWAVVYSTPVFVSAWYFYYSFKMIELRREPDHRARYAFIFPFVAIILAIITFRHPYALTALFMNALSVFFLEEYVISEIKWMTKKWVGNKGVTFWTMVPSEDEKMGEKIKSSILMVEILDYDQDDREKQKEVEND